MQPAAGGRQAAGSSQAGAQHGAARRHSAAAPTCGVGQVPQRRRHQDAHIGHGPGQAQVPEQLQHSPRPAAARDSVSSGAGDCGCSLQGCPAASWPPSAACNVASDERRCTGACPGTAQRRQPLTCCKSATPACSGGPRRCAPARQAGPGAWQRRRRGAGAAPISPPCVHAWVWRRPQKRAELTCASSRRCPCCDCCAAKCTVLPASMLATSVQKRSHSTHTPSTSTMATMRARGSC